MAQACSRGSQGYGPRFRFFDGLSPYEQVPFQFSMHRVAAPGMKPEHHSFLAEGQS